MGGRFIIDFYTSRFLFVTRGAILIGRMNAGLRHFHTTRFIETIAIFLYMKNSYTRKSSQ